MDYVECAHMPHLKFDVGGSEFVREGLATHLLLNPETGGTANKGTDPCLYQLSLHRGAKMFSCSRIFQIGNEKGFTI